MPSGWGRMILFRGNGGCHYKHYAKVRISILEMLASNPIESGGIRNY